MFKNIVYFLAGMALQYFAPSLFERVILEPIYALYSTKIMTIRLFEIGLIVLTWFIVSKVSNVKPFKSGSTLVAVVQTVLIALWILMVNIQYHP